MTAAPVKLEGNALSRSAIVFSPHQDDETLGCGGTIIHKKRAGADLKIVFITDGSSSHAHLMPKEQLKSIRAQEAIAAANILGVSQEDVIFLEFRDGSLANYQEAATQEVIDILRRYQPEEVFIPYRKEAQPDHAATYEIVMTALQHCQLHPVIYEYPIWFWRHWPWTRFGNTRREALDVLKDSLRAGFGLGLVQNFQSAVFVGDVIDLKRLALDQHRSQMSPIIPKSGWLTLKDVSNGDFLECFFQDHEFFHCEIRGE